ncbi:MAG TPA: rhodanese-like domain-containing protein [Acidimicrobiales bacterium]|nr:rhodanese-like domain-containing protein [Acidimicrobiales bacterium]
MEVTTSDLADALDAYVLDVRRYEEWVDKRIPGVTLIPMDQINDRVGEIPKDRRVFVVCAVGGRSAKVAQALRNAGYDAVNVQGGTNKWVEEGRPFESGE